ncbi:MAG: hypothetical protein O3A40_00285 [Bacteroidetes bacterium]|nr:hypothetical protein [Bacteroidota bacterium]
MTNRWYLLLVSLILITQPSCKSDYQKMEEQELSSGKTVKELFFGVELGMSQKQFFEICWTLNKEGVLTNGPTELSVEHSLVFPSGTPGKMRFYPQFEADKIYLMPLEFTYDGWSHWNKELALEVLKADVIQLFENWYGEGFIEVINEDKSQIAFVKMDGSRRIRVFKKTIASVRAAISYIPVQKKLS